MRIAPPRASCLPLVLAGALIACVPTKPPFKTNVQRTRTFASVRVLNLLSDAVSVETIISVKDDLPGGFAPVASPAISAFQPVAVGEWTAFLSQDGATSAGSAALTPTEGQRLTLVESGTSASAALSWKPESPPSLGTDQSAARVVAGAPALAGAEVKLGTTTAATSAVLGALSDWSSFPAAQALTVTVSLPGQATTFTVPAGDAGRLHTFALVQASAEDTALRLVDFVEAPNGDATASTPIAPNP